MDNIQSTPRNPFIGGLADLLRQGKDFANTYEMKDWVPLIGGTGLGDMFMGKAPELINDISYDGLQAAVRGGNAATGGIGTYGARPAVADAALLGMDVAGVGAGLKGLSKRSASALIDHLSSGSISLSRRDALKKLGGVAGGAALTGTGLGTARKFLDNAVVDVAPKVMDNVAAQTAKQYKFNSLADYIANAAMRAEDELGITASELGGFSDRELENFVESNLSKELKSTLIRDEQAYKNAKDIKSGYLKVDNPSIYDLKPLEEFSPQAKAEMKDFKSGVNKLSSDYGYHPEDAQWSDWLINSPDTNKTLEALREFQRTGILPGG